MHSLIGCEICMHKSSVSLSTVGTDYKVDTSSLSVTVSAGDPAPICVPVSIVDDDVALEENETLVVRFDSLDEGIVPLEPDEAVVTIVDDDKGKMVAT